MIGRNDLCWCGSYRKWKKCHFPQRGPEPLSHSETPKIYREKYDILIKTEEEIAGIRRSCQLAAAILDKLCEAAVEGVTTDQLNTLAEKLHKEAGAIAAPLGYSKPPFPKSICTSLNEVICHGIPDKTQLKSGDILNIDVTSILDGYYGDCSRMVTVGSVSEEKQRVVDVAYETLMRSIEVVKPGVPIHAIGDIIEPYARERDCSVVYQFVGHGVGVRFHEGPQIPHCLNNIAVLFVEGMTFTIEPMINAGRADAVVDETDQWTARTVDGKASAQWEHTLLVTKDGCEILTPWKR